MDFCFLDLDGLIFCYGFFFFLDFGFQWSLGLAWIGWFGLARWWCGGGMVVDIIGPLAKLVNQLVNHNQLPRPKNRKLPCPGLVFAIDQITQLYRWRQKIENCLDWVFICQCC
ncbi:hypothetical protein ACJW31_10G018400 [Castanea mollissima]